MSQVRYVFYSFGRDQWLEFIPLKKNNQDGEDIVDLTFEKLPNSIYGKIEIGIMFGNPVYMFKTVDKDRIQLSSSI